MLQYIVPIPVHSRAAPGNIRLSRNAHPDYGTLTVGWVAYQMAGHDFHHLKHIETIDAAGQARRREPPP